MMVFIKGPVYLMVNKAQLSEHTLRPLLFIYKKKRKEKKSGEGKIIFRVRFYAILRELLLPGKSPLCIKTYPPMFHYDESWGPLNV